MVYSLTNASALGLDLVRTPGGVEVAGVLLRGLLSPAGADPSSPPVRGPADLAVARVRALTLAGPQGPTVVDLTTGEEPEEDPDELTRTLRRMLRRLGAVSFGTVGDLMTLAAGLPGGLSPEGVSPQGASSSEPSLRLVDALQVERGQVLADAVLAAVVRHRDDPAAPVLARALSQRLDPGADLLPALPPAPAPGRALPGQSPVMRRTAELLQRIAGVPDPLDLLPAHGPAPHVWAQHMHEAAWAVETTGRTRLAAAAQLDLLRCLDVAGVDAATCLSGVWNTCSAAVQAHVVADVLAADSWTVLTADLLEGLGGTALNSGPDLPI
ncbi:hypothetical protein [Aquipuribacter sp. MA13-6]|uniref:hypothetical protein n=1 Tax=unclassified Aquipuribacter TaxID=2635084 RepID=UPI003EE834DD